MKRALLILLATYGFKLSIESTRTIRRLSKEAAKGDRHAKDHFTQSRYAHVLGPRNSDLGMVFYSAIIVAAATGALRRTAVFIVALLASSASLAVSFYLLWALFVRLRVSCRICLKAHATNFAIFALLLGLRSENSK